MTRAALAEVTQRARERDQQIAEASVRAAEKSAAAAEEAARIAERNLWIAGLTGAFAGGTLMLGILTWRDRRREQQATAKRPKRR